MVIFMGKCDGFNLCSADGTQMVMAASAIAAFLSNGLSRGELEILIRLLYVVIKCLDSINDISVLQDIECKPGEEL